MRSVVMGRMQSKVILITGGSSGIGKATAKAFALEGAKVVIASRGEEKGKDAVREIRAIGGEAFFVRTDVSQEEQVKNLVEMAVSEYGRVDFAFNNAGVEGRGARLASETMEMWNEIMDINLKGVWLCMKYEIVQMRKQGGGVIINNSSSSGLGGAPRLTIYSASKHGVVGLTKGAALEYISDNIRINALCPGIIKTPMHDERLSTTPGLEKIMLSMIPMGKFGKPEEVAAAVMWMCSDDASYMTGSTILLGGGQAVSV
jgi:NAD(P)-dependent dehydrogenase (short-subunit alcohol dehydrogenase family)